MSAYKLQYGASARLWLANLAHRQAGDDLISMVNGYVEEASSLLESLLVEGARQTPKSRRKSSIVGHVAVKNSRSPRLSKIGSPKASRTTRQRVPAAPKKAAPTTRARAGAATRTTTSSRAATSKAKAPPVTPKAKSRTGTQLHRRAFYAFRITRFDSIAACDNQCYENSPKTINGGKGVGAYAL